MAKGRRSVRRSSKTGRFCKKASKAKACKRSYVKKGRKSSKKGRKSSKRRGRK